MNLLSIILAFAFPIIADDLACNGDVRLCNRRYSNISLIGSHNSAFVGILPTNNQYVSVTEQLNIGVRFLQVQTRGHDGSIQLCHTSCWVLNAGPLSGYLREVATWMAKNPREVLTVLITNSDGMAVERFAEAVRDAHLDGIVYRPAGQPALNEWPTLQEFLDYGVRLIVFMVLDSYADTTKVDYILPQFLYQWQNAYGQTDSAFSNCSIDRPKRIQHPETYMYMINHFLDVQLPFDIIIPNQFEAGSTNSLESIIKQAEMCGVQWGVKPNVILVGSLP
ncbi:hypothetical protein Cpir12675_005223 [Ceratocystis pirilliformis]|uniref:PI-PLC X domain-containing protein 1 n=1 Tax=Ceratocystis pirilliformis TaxID=259994 RepID=A0ABR3YSG8_9PEZI